MDKHIPFLQSGNLFRVLDTLSDVVACLDENLRVLHFNPAALRFFSMGPEEIQGYDAINFLPRELHGIGQRFLQRYGNGRQLDLRERIFRLKLKTKIRPQGKSAHEGGTLLVPVSLSISPLSTELGPAFVAIIRRRMSVMGAAYDQHNAIKTTLSAVSHEIRNPLVAIGGFARRIALDPGLNQKSRHQLDIIQDEVERLERLVTGLNDLSKSTAYHFEMVDIKEVLGHVGEIMAQQAKEEGKTLEFELMSDPPRLLIDRDRISQVLINLVRNALQACARGGRVCIWAGPMEKPEFIRISISDNGQGITQENLNRLFQPFFTTKKGGTGLGLAVSRRIVEDHGGRLEVKSVFGQGTVISVLLPL